jgi:hypothetical protein
VETALKTLLRDYPYIFTYRKDPLQGKRILKEVKTIDTAIGSKPSKRRIVTVEIPYGSGKGEVGAVKGGEGANTGPKSFAVDDQGNIYVCDTLNKRVQIFSLGGAYLSTIPLTQGISAEDIIVDRHGSVYIYDGSVRRLYQFERNGTILSSIGVDVGRWGDGGTMHMVNNEIYVYACDTDESCGDFIIGRVIDRVLVGLSEEEPRGYKEMGRQAFSGRKYMTKLVGFKRSEMEMFWKESALSEKISFPFEEIQSIEFLGEDGRANVYAQTLRSTQKMEIVVEIQKFDSHYNYLSTITVPKRDVFFVPHKEYSVSKDGTIYRFLPEDDKLRLDIFLSENN